MSYAQEKVLELCNDEEYERAWLYWKLVGNSYSIFLGEVFSEDFIDGETLASQMTLTNGRPINSDTSWLKFFYLDEIIYIPKKPVRHNIQWSAIYMSGAVYGSGDCGGVNLKSKKIQDSRVYVNDNNYQVSLIQSSDSKSNVSPALVGHGLSCTKSSEWNNLLFPIHEGCNDFIHTVDDVPFNVWESYTDEDLGIGTRQKGGASWTQEVSNDGYGSPTYRGRRGISHYATHILPTSVEYFGWRPALRRKVF